MFLGKTLVQVYRPEDSDKQQQQKVTYRNESPIPPPGGAVPPPYRPQPALLAIGRRSELEISLKRLSTPFKSPSACYYGKNEQGIAALRPGAENASDPSPAGLPPTVSWSVDNDHLAAACHPDEVTIADQHTATYICYTYNTYAYTLKPPEASPHRSSASRGRRIPRQAVPAAARPNPATTSQSTYTGAPTS
ncbi:hypothetical protein CIB48_g6677 [Xylaria polymorpha]|nr:hypothetical protein CIB48_g6677 [Xylaria polymorpha]